MSFIAIPASVGWLQTADPHVVKWEHFIQCLVDYAEWLRASGVPEERIGDPATFAQPGDLQMFINVVNWWPKDAPPAYRVPTLYSMLSELNLGNDMDARNFTVALDWYVERVKTWLAGNRRNPENPNESKPERDARLNRERVARHRLRHSAGSDDPQLDGLIKAAKAAVENAAAGRKWLKDAERQAKLDMDAAIAAARVARADTVSTAQAAVHNAELQAQAAQAAVEEYKSN